MSQRSRSRQFQFDDVDAVIEGIGHSQPHLEWMHAPKAFAVFSDPIIQSLLDDPDVGPWLQNRIAWHRNLEMLRHISAAEPEEQLIAGGIIKAAQEARIRKEKEDDQGKADP